VGNTAYKPAIINNVGTSADFKVRVFSNVYENGTAGSVIQNNEASVKKTWEIAPTTATPGPNVAITLQWTAAEEGSYFTTARTSSPSTLYLGKNTGIGNSAWVPPVVSASNFTTSPFSITTPSITTFSKFAVGSSMNPLPVSMGDLHAKASPAGNKLTWNTYSEVDAKGFYIQRSDNGKDFVDVGYVAAVGSSNAKRAYSYTDKASGHRVYYKVRFQGKSKTDVAFSNTVTLTPYSLAGLGTYPNPTQGILYVEATEDDETTVNATYFRFTDIGGKQHIVHAGAFGSQGYKLNLAQLHAGVYILEKVTNGDVVAKARVIKQ
jgi:hypothetical protein